MIGYMLLAFLLVIAIGIIRLRSLIAIVMLAGMYSLISALIFVVMDAVDVAFTEAAVGAGITTVLFLATLSLTGKRHREEKRVAVTPIIVVLLTGAVLIYGTLDMPNYGDPTAPIHQHVAPRYIEESPKEVGIPNMVTSVLASYRGYDTLGEVTVIFTAGIAVMILLANRRRRDDDEKNEDES